MDVAGVRFGTGRFGAALQVGGGVTGSLTRRLSLYADVAWQDSVSGAGFRGWSFNGGLRLTLGAGPAAQ